MIFINRPFSSFAQDSSNIPKIFQKAILFHLCIVYCGFLKYYIIFSYFVPLYKAKHKKSCSINGFFFSSLFCVMQNLSENDALCLVMDQFQNQLYFGFSTLICWIEHKFGNFLRFFFLFAALLFLCP